MVKLEVAWGASLSFAVKIWWREALRPCRAAQQSTAIGIATAECLRTLDFKPMVCVFF